MEQVHRKQFRLFPFIISLLITLAIGIAASLFTRPEIAGWYMHLHKPSFTPPSWLFAPVWTSIYIMIAIAAYLVWQRRDGSPLYRKTAWVYSIQLLLNFSWSIIFFGTHQIAGGLGVIIALWIMIVINIYFFRKFSVLAGWLLVPYLLWVSFATALNLAIYLLNK